MPEKDETDNPIKVTDRRSFTPEGDRKEAEPADAGKEEPPKTVEGEGFTMRDEESAAEGGAGSPPQVDFTSFILSLASTAFIYLGEVEDPVTKSRNLDPAAARQMIDIIQMLHDKTSGNLDPKESEFIRGVLYELKMKFAGKVSSD
jgi:hypothetical protein